MATYGYDTNYSYNIFGADEHIVVTLYRLNKKGTKWKYVERWAYSTFLSPALAERRAASREFRLERRYGARCID